MEFIDAMAHLAQFKVGQIIKFTLPSKTISIVGVVINRPQVIHSAGTWEEKVDSDAACLKGLKIGFFQRQNYEVLEIPFAAKVEFASIEEIELFTKKKEAYNILTQL